LDLRHLQAIRLFELGVVLSELEPFVPLGARILEIGAGSGWQARRLAEQGYVVHALEVEDSQYRDHSVWPILQYDGKHTPFADGSFDAVFSSNVLEHVPHLADLMVESLRVLKSSGVAIHVVPTATWRFWTIFSHYPYAAKRALSLLQREGSGTLAPARGKSTKDMMKAAAVPARHGESGSALSELCRFTRAGWLRALSTTGWRVVKVMPNGLFYTGSMLLGAAVPLATRRRLSGVLGSSCHVIVLQRDSHTAAIGR
jgi:hypothetical protein